MHSQKVPAAWVDVTASAFRLAVDNHVSIAFQDLFKSIADVEHVLSFRANLKMFTESAILKNDAFPALDHLENPATFAFAVGLDVVATTSCLIGASPRSATSHWCDFGKSSLKSWIPT